jgi:polyisoprenoid-binding protein YceI
MKRISSILLVLLLSSNTFAQNWKPVTANVSFKIKHALGASATGNFKGFVGGINFNPANLTTASIRASVDATTIDTDNSIRDKVIKGTDYFNVEKFPKISMVSTKVEKGSKEGEFIGTFNLTIKNSTKSIKLPFSFTESNGKGTFATTFTINRLDYGVGGKSSMLGDVATITIKLNTQL